MLSSVEHRYFLEPLGYKVVYYSVYYIIFKRNLCINYSSVTKNSSKDILTEGILLHEEFMTIVS